jgi:hypothetical protein
LSRLTCPLLHLTIPVPRPNQMIIANHASYPMARPSLGLITNQAIFDSMSYGAGISRFQGA